MSRYNVMNFYMLKRAGQKQFIFSFPCRASFGWPSIFSILSPIATNVIVVITSAYTELQAFLTSPSLFFRVLRYFLLSINSLSFSIYVSVPFCSFKFYLNKHQGRQV